MSRKTKGRKTKGDPRQMAALAVQEWYDALIQSADAHTDGHIYQCSLGEAFNNVTDALEAEHVAQFGPITPDQDAEMEMIGREAGYLIGVQVGLRLREKGGR